MQSPIVVQPGAPAEPPPKSDESSTRTPAGIDRPPVIWMEMPQAIEGVPPGLEYLSLVNQLTVHQHVDALELVTGYEIANKYSLFNTLGQQVYFAFEESSCIGRSCCGPKRGFKMHIVDNSNKEVMCIKRPYNCCLGCCAMSSCCAAMVTVEAPPGHVVGTVHQQCGWCSTNLAVYLGDTQILKIKGPNKCCPCYTCCFTADKVFKVRSSANNEQIGAIRKKFRGMVVEAFTDADTFSVEFPIDLDVKHKAALLGATFLIDFLCFEGTEAKKNKE